MTEGNSPLWTPRPEQIPPNFARFIAKVEARSGRRIADYGALHHWSVDDRAGFWDLVWDELGVIGEKGERRLVEGASMQDARFFPDARLNFAENLLRRNDDSVAIVVRAEDGPTTRMTWAELNRLVSRLQQAMRAAGLKAGDRVAAMLPNVAESVALMLAATSLGAIWSSCSPDFGERGVLDRFGQIEPKLFVTVDGYWYGGKRIDIADKLAEIVANLPTVIRTIVVSNLGAGEQVATKLRGAVSMEAFIASFAPMPVTYKRLGFAHPLYILFSSGTTGVPKCIVHSVGGTLLQQAKEHRLHCGIVPGDRVFYFTTLGWMMWNWLVAALSSEATLVLYDGNPLAPRPEILWDYAVEERVTLFGTSAKYLDSLRKLDLRPRDSHDLSSIRLITSTGSPLAPEGFQYVYDAIAPDIHLASISGGTDIASCFVLGVPGLPVWKSEIQGPGLGMAVEVWDDDGKPMGRGAGKGELVCVKAFPSQPAMFWNDVDGSKYRSAYFDRFPGIWCHGDFAEWTEHGGMVIHGRSDATLNPGGVRIGTAEIYAQVEQIPEVLESLAIGQAWDNDVRVVLFVRLRAGVALDDRLIDAIRRKIRIGASPRHVPAKIVAVADIPRTKSGKITELAVRDVVHGREVKNKEALANPEALDLYANLPELTT